MESASPFLTILIGTLLRLGLPILLTVVLIFLLSRMDQSWTKQALREGAVSPSAYAHNVGCWDKKNCPHEARQHCDAYAHPETPCWQVYRSSSGELRESCLGCEIFLEAPIPVAA